jgi:DnaK suppressor protein
MDPKKFQQLEQRLRQMAAELERGRRQLDRAALHLEPAAEECERQTLAGQRELAAQQLDHSAELLRNVRAALARLKDGSYGHCLDCGHPISERRLSAVPWALRCLDCQDRHDRRAPGAGGSWQAAAPFAA